MVIEKNIKSNQLKIINHQLIRIVPTEALTLSESDLLLTGQAKQHECAGEIKNSALVKLTTFYKLALVILAVLDYYFC